MRQWIAALAAWAALTAAAARAHDADIVYVQADLRRGEVKETATLTAATLCILAPLDANGDGALSQGELDRHQAAVEAGFWESVPLYAGGAQCRRTFSAAAVREGYVELTASFACGEGELRQVFKVLSLLPGGYRVILGSQRDGSQSQTFAQGGQQTLYLSSAAKPPSGPQGLWGWVSLGLFHIFTGYDHLAFLAALILASRGWKRLLALATSFTVAHSITLGATALGAVQLGPLAQRAVEAGIAATIVFVAVENLFLRGDRGRSWITFAFGLVHGFGFASVLRSYGMAEGAAGALFGFNLGVEAGQACAIAAAYPALLLVRKSAHWDRRPQVAGSLAIAAAGAYWLIRRTLG